jgi:hypothetical protein
MRLIFTILSILLFGLVSDAQKITGIWRGYFTSTPIIRDGLGEERYKYEIQIEQKSNNSIRGVTYSYKSTVFYGKAELTGILTLPAKTLIIRETKLVDLKIGDKSEPCLMTCYLDYTRIGKLEVLEGTFISTNVKDKRDCGSGKVYLERVRESDFETEDFLVKNRKTSPSAKKNPASGGIAGLKPGIANSKAPGKAAVKPPVKNPSATNPLAGNRNAARPQVKRPGTIPPAQQKTQQPEKAELQATTTLPKEQPVAPPQKLENTFKKLPVPRVLMERENNLIRTINISDPDATIEFYDNGTIDNDTITVYHNNQMVISKGRLSLSPLSVKIHCTEEDPVHEIVVVADNLGEIPPNTAMMVIKIGKDKTVGRYEIFLTSNEQRNAKVVLRYASNK